MCAVGRDARIAVQGAGGHDDAAALARDARRGAAAATTERNAEESRLRHFEVDDLRARRA